MFFEALLVGLIISLPVGPIAILILQRSLKLGYLAGLASGIGAAVADGLFAFLAAFGIAALTLWIQESIGWVRPVGGMVLIGLGVHFFFQKPPELKTEEVLTPRFLHHYTWDGFSNFILTLTNTMTILAFVALFTASQIVPEDPTKINYLEIISGVFCGSLFWWVTMVTLSHKIKQIISPMTVHRLMQFLAGVLVFLGTLAVLTLFKLQDIF
ncbi:MAG: LysE family transporter [bacterium]|nr:LysE family transporter [bacterium]